MKKLDVLILSFILITAFTLRLYKINSPLADFHSWRQADTASVARNFVDKGFNLLLPTYDDYSNVQSGMENPHGYRMVEFPLYNAMIAKAYQTFPVFPLEVWGRLISIGFSLIIIAIVYYLLSKEVGRLSAITGSLIYAVMPLFVFFSRVVLPETTALGFTMIGLLLFYLNEKNKSINWLLFIGSSVSMAIAILVKPTVIFYFLPIAVIWLKKYKINVYKKIPLYIYTIIALTPFILWRLYIKNFPEGIPVSDWLITSVNTPQGLKNIFFRPAFFRWIFLERINNLILGGYLTVFFIIGIIPNSKKIFLQSIVYSIFVFLFTFQGGNVQHEYYQTIIFPGIAIACGIGIDVFINFFKHNYSKLSAIFVIVILSLFSFYFSFNKVIGYFQHTTELVPIANIINTLTKPDDLIVVDRMGDTTLLYLADRKGASSIFYDPLDLGSIGYKYLVTASPAQIMMMEDQFEIVFKNENFTIFKL